MDLTMKRICQTFKEMGGVMEEEKRVSKELGVAKGAIRELEKLLFDTQQLVMQGGSLPTTPTTQGREEEVEEVEEVKEVEGDASSGIAEDDSEEDFPEEEEGEEMGGEYHHEVIQKKELEKRVVQRLNGLLSSYYRSPVKIGTVSSLSIKKLLRLFEEIDVSSPLSFEVLKEVSEILHSQNDLQVEL
eukprot:CAMPEP_0201537380 /NCGR_PEP_ID=MMETSP0161_2-20130828/64610_1 /ASSEMBLY_ACC=CAM_ASM_000251 /TAXON_ID=180227 /ORGANISM="Neoparamoeba aestuarina, Strain SoJaBio B1-5/56/2" /LENGTH=186 /DNA_ID=CAMNT_0047943629 /DNA_START=210 /DNA_END=770 /DNA_ORIENTATION=+